MNPYPQKLILTEQKLLPILLPRLCDVETNDYLLYIHQYGSFYICNLTLTNVCDKQMFCHVVCILFCKD